MRLKILHITPAFQHPLVRGSDRHYQLLRELARHHDLTLLTLARSEIPDEAMEELRALTSDLFAIDVSVNGADHILPTAIGRRLEREWRFRQGLAQMKEIFERLTREESFDILLFHGKSVFPVIEAYEARPVVVDFCDATSFRVRTKMRHAGKAKIPLLMLRYLKVRATEKQMVRKASRLIFITRRDREKILGPGDSSPIVSNGIDLDYWRRRTSNPRPNCLIFTGVMDYGPNEDAALYLIDEILPLLKQSRPEVEIIIAGRSPTPALLRRDERHPEVTVTGFVEDMRTWLEKGAVFVAPLRYGSGQQNKILEAMAMEVPVVTTTTTAEGVRVEDEQVPPLCVADDAPSIARSVLQLLEQPSERARLAADGRQYMEKYFNWSQSASQVEAMCFEVLEGKGHERGRCSTERSI